MDFFERQEKARHNTKVLVFYFCLAILFLTVAAYLAALLTFTGVEFKSSMGEAQVSFWQPELFLWSAFGTLSVVFIGSVSKTMQLARGGSAVAELLDGRLIDSNTRKADERKLLNVVEEMSIASGVPVPQVYVMDNEPGINAFAAGHSPSDAAISVTRGGMTILSRDELQGVVAHEFSHILNGDMRLNLRLMGLIFGILCLTVVGRILIRTRGRRNPLPLFGLALIIIGWVGVFFGRLIQAAVSRQRESLADASGVQFTRNPAGLAGALKKIGGLAYGSRIESPHAEEASHLFFANGLADAFFGFATHPPLIERIRALDPGFDGKYPTVMIAPPEATAPPAQPTPAIPEPGAQPGFLAPTTIAQPAIVADIGQPQAQHLSYATEFHQAMPDSLQAAARDPLEASALIFALLLDNDPSVRQKQVSDITRLVSGPAGQETLRLWPELQSLPAQAKIPLVDLALPALRRLSPQQFEQFREALKNLMASDEKTDLFEYMLQKIVIRHLETYFSPGRRQITQFYDLRPLVPDCGVLLSATAYAGQEDATSAHAAFAVGAGPLGQIAGREIPWFPPGQCDLAHLDIALERLSQAVPQIKKNVLNACVQTVAADNVIQETEAELVRAIADALDCPVPPLAGRPIPASLT